MNLTTIFYGVLPILGVIIGAGLQYVFSKSSEEYKQHYIHKTQAYIDFLESVSEMANTIKFERSNNRRVEILAKAANSKTRISIYGSKKVIEALAQFEKNGPHIDNKVSSDSFLTICNEMRRDILGKKEIAKLSDLHLVLLGKEIFP